jgi:hypothetical protein
MKKICENKDCGKEFETRDNRRRFCSMSCSAHCNNIGVRRHGKESGNCLYCGKKLVGSKRKYCNNKCQQELEWEKRKSEIDKYGVFPCDSQSGETSRRIVRKYLIEKFGNKCSICGMIEWMGQEIPLVVDHIDGNSKNHSKENFRMVCGNCNMQLPTFAGKNKNGTRSWRVKRYADGKSS